MSDDASAGVHFFHEAAKSEIWRKVRGGAALTSYASLISAKKVLPVLSRPEYVAGGSPSVEMDWMARWKCGIFSKIKLVLKPDPSTCNCPTWRLETRHGSSWGVQTSGRSGRFWREKKKIPAWNLLPTSWITYPGGLKPPNVVGFVLEVLPACSI